ncbi:MAG: photosystem II manganese-stabilizing polypeptide [Cyanobacteria bacterium P01_H01_bin.21]
MKYRTLITGLLVLCFGLVTACSGGPQADSLSYDDIKGSGLANNCPQLSRSSRDAIAIDANQSYQLNGLCLQPETFLVKGSSMVKSQENDFVVSKPLTRESFSLDQVSGSLQVDSDGNIIFAEQGGFDFQPVTVQPPNGERVALLFTIKGLVAKNQDVSNKLTPTSRLVGTFQVPPYRTSNFIDPKGRGLSSGYDAAVGLPIQADREDFSRQNSKSFEVGEGEISLQITQVNRKTGEIAGLFESNQPSDTDFGAKEPMDVKIQGQFYGRIDQTVA